MREPNPSELLESELLEQNPPGAQVHVSAAAVAPSLSGAVRTAAERTVLLSFAPRMAVVTLSGCAPDAVAGAQVALHDAGFAPSHAPSADLGKVAQRTTTGAAQRLKACGGAQVHHVRICRAHQGPCVGGDLRKLTRTKYDISCIDS